MFEYVRVFLYLTPKIGPLSATNCTFYGCDHRINTKKLVAKAFRLFYLVFCFSDIRGPEVSWLLCFFVFLSYPKSKKHWIFGAFCFDHVSNKKRFFWSLRDVWSFFSLFLLKDQYSLAFTHFTVSLILRNFLVVFTYFSTL